MGYMPMAQRRSVLAAFKTDPNVRVILMSLKAGGEGLNLQEASHVLVLEPWWNPAVRVVPHSREPKRTDAVGCER
jgi:DNA repair protein RAD16